MQQRELRIVLHGQRQGVREGVVRAVREVRAEQDLLQVNRVRPFFASDEVVRWFANRQDRAARLAQVFSVTDPSIKRSTPWRPCVPMTIRSTSFRWAKARVASGRRPFWITRSGCIPLRG